MNAEALPWIVEDLIQLGVGMVMKDGVPHLHFEDADPLAQWAAYAVQGVLSEHRDKAVWLFKRGGTCGDRQPVQCEECRGWVYSLCLVQEACRVVDGRKCRFRPATTT
jgi:hypothetical protein